MAGTERATKSSPPSAEGVGRKRLVVAFPEPRTLPLPESGEPFGRSQLEKHTGIADGRVSEQHFTIWQRGGTFIEDLKSTHGTWVEGERLEPGEHVGLDEGALVRIGKTLLVFRGNLIGSDDRSPPLGKMTGPYGLRHVEQALATIEANRTRRPRNVLIEGETGTGKELLAREIASRLGRVRRYEACNVATIPDERAEAELFGYGPRAFTDAGPVGSPGLFRRNAGGTVFLDEIEDASRALQAKLLRLLENREVKPLNQPAEQVDVAVVAATNRSLEGMADEKSFRNDLRMRFERPVLRLPPLRERREDIFAIAMAWLTEAGTPVDPRTLKVEAMEWLLRAHWDGNVRELGHALEEIVGAGQPATLALPAVQRAVALDGRVRRALTNAAAHESMRRHKDNQSAAARGLGVPLPTLRRKLGMV